MNGPSRRVRGWVVGFAVVGLAAACSSGSDGGREKAASGSSTTASSSSNVDRSATLRVGFTLSPSSWDPIKVNSANSAASYLALVYDQLVELGPNLEPKAGIAKKWEVSDDGLTTTFDLRDDVKFSDGTALDAAAVKANLDRDRATGTSLTGVLAGVSSVEAPDATTVAVTFSEPNYVFAYAVAQDTRLGSIVNPKAFTDPSLATTPRGSGPYRLVSSSTSVATFERVDGHWDKTSGLARAIELRTILDPGARLNALRSGQIDVAFTLPDQKADTERAAKLVTFDPTPAIQTLLVNYARGPLAEPDVRKAISLAIDRQTLAQTAFGGLCTPTQQMFPPTVAGYAMDLDSASALKPDVAKAKQLLAGAGYGDGFAMTLLLSSGNASLTNAAQILQQELGAIGIRVALTTQPTAEAGPNFAQGKFDTYLASLNGAIEPQIVLDSNLVAPGKGFGMPGYLGSAATAAAEKPQGADRDKAYEAINQTLVEKPVHIPYCNNPILLGVSKKVVGTDAVAYGRTIQGIIDARRMGIAIS